MIKNIYFLFSIFSLTMFFLVLSNFLMSQSCVRSFQVTLWTNTGWNHSQRLHVFQPLLKLEAVLSSTFFFRIKRFTWLNHNKRKWIVCQKVNEFLSVNASPLSSSHIYSRILTCHVSLSSRLQQTRLNMLGHSIRREDRAGRPVICFHTGGNQEAQNLHLAKERSCIFMLL